MITKSLTEDDRCPKCGEALVRTPGVFYWRGTFKPGMVCKGCRGLWPIKGEEIQPLKEKRMREITTHKVNGCNESLTITVQDEPGSGGANHNYLITGFNGDSNPSTRIALGYCLDAVGILFQNGPLKEAGANGVTHEALLAIVADRLECFQAGKFACDENQEALGHVKAAMAVLKSRTEKRLARGVEGTHQV